MSSSNVQELFLAFMLLAELVTMSHKGAVSLKSLLSIL